MRGEKRYEDKQDRALHEVNAKLVKDYLQERDIVVKSVLE